MSRRIQLLLCLSAVACGDALPAPNQPGTSVDITTDRGAYRPSDTVTVAVHNITNGTINFTLCPGTLERWTGSAWEVIDSWPGPGAAACALIGGPLAANGSFAARFSITAQAIPGQYRIEFFAIEIGNQLPIEDRVTHLFQVGM